MMQVAYEPRTLAEMHARKRQADRRQAERAAQHRRDTAERAQADLIRVEEARLRSLEPAPQAEPETVVWPAASGTMPRSRQIIRAVASHYGVSVADLSGPRRTAGIVHARQRLMVALYVECPNLSLPAIGAAIGGKDHTTVLHACRKFGVWPGRVWPLELTDLRDLVADALDAALNDGWHGEGCA